MPTIKAKRASHHRDTEGQRKPAVAAATTAVPRWDDLVNGVDEAILDKGFIKVPEKPRLGVRLNEEAVKQHLGEGGSYEPTPQWNVDRTNHRLIELNAMKTRTSLLCIAAAFAAAALVPTPAGAQIYTLTKDQMVKLTQQNPFDR